MKRLIQFAVLATFVVALMIPATAFAGESEYARISGPNPSPGTSSKWIRAMSGSVAGVAPMTASIQNRSSSVYSYITRKSTYVPAGTGVSSTYVTWAVTMYWRLGLTGIDGYGVLTAN